MNVVRGVIGVVILGLIAFLCSNNRKGIRYRPVLCSLAVQVIFAFLVLQWAPGRAVLNGLSAKVQTLIGYANQGIAFLFGGLVKANGPSIFALQVLPVIIFLASLIGILYYLRVIQWVISILGGAIARVIGTSQLESLSAAATVFLGQSEAPLLIRPYVAGLTRAELFQVMTSGFTSVAGSTLVGYALLGVPLPYLLTASVMTAPAGLVMAKLMFPETERPRAGKEIQIAADTTSANVIDAAATGALDGLRLAVNVGALLLAFISIIALLNGLLSGAGGLFGHPDVTLQKILGFILAPVAFAIGVPWSEAVTAGGFLGEKTVLNEFVAYVSFAPRIHTLSPKTVIIVTFALCGFANFTSIAIQIGTLGSLAPERRGDVARYGLRALLAATLANLSNAAIAGMFVG